ncbi:MAG: hypothetical protein ACAH89_06400 [Rariglobus sp.]|nr:hypothetical protein [Rariglobus sp.]
MKYTSLFRILPLAIGLSATGGTVALHAQTTVTTADKPSATPVADALAALKKITAERLAAIEAGTEVPNRFDWTALNGELPAIEASLTGGNANEIRNTLQNLGQRLKSPEIKQQIATLNAAVAAQKTADEDSARLSFEKRLTAMSTTALAAKTSDVIDPLFDQLTAFEEELGNDYKPRLARVREGIQRQRNFLQTWQRLLEAQVDGDRNQVRNFISNLDQFARPFGIDRATLRAATKKLSGSSATSADMDAIMGSLTLEGLADAREKLISDQSNGMNFDYNTRSSLVGQIDSILAAEAALQSGRTDDAQRIFRGERSVTYGGSLLSQQYVAISKLRDAWVYRALPRLSELKDIPAANKDEPFEAYLNRQLLAADSAGDWDRALGFARLLKSLSPVSPWSQITTGTKITDDPGAALLAYQRGQLLAAANQPDAAAELYREALKSGATPKLQARLVSLLRGSPAEAAH